MMLVNFWHVEFGSKRIQHKGYSHAKRKIITAHYQSVIKRALSSKLIQNYNNEGAIEQIRQNPYSPHRLNYSNKGST